MKDKDTFPKVANEQLKNNDTHHLHSKSDDIQNKFNKEFDIDPENVSKEMTKNKSRRATMIRTANAHWEGNLKEGTGYLFSESGVLEKTNYSFKTRFEEGVKGTNPEELIAAAHAGCFTMAVCAKLNEKGITPKTLDTRAKIIMNDLGIVSMHLKIYGAVPNISSEDFTAITKDAEENCFVSKILNIPITSEVSFEFEDS